VDHELEWDTADQATRNAHAEELDAVRDGAYAMAFVVLDARLDRVIVSRAEHGTGCDWYVAKRGAGFDADGRPDLEHPSIRRLEVSGTMQGDVSRRVQDKLRQLQKGDSSLPGYAGVVGFDVPIVVIREAELL
jgi:hypothetical protein